jgi:hypothetical protein
MFLAHLLLLDTLRSEHTPFMSGKNVMTCWQHENKIGAVIRFYKAGKIQRALQQVIEGGQ